MIYQNQQFLAITFNNCKQTNSNKNQHNSNEINMDKNGHDDGKRSQVKWIFAGSQVREYWMNIECFWQLWQFYVLRVEFVAALECVCMKIVHSYTVGITSANACEYVSKQRFRIDANQHITTQQVCVYRSI